MARLPTPGGDNGNWGTILNEYLSQSLGPDGTLKDDVVTDSTIADNAISTTSIQDGVVTEVKLASAVQTKLNQAAPTWTSLSGKPAVIAAGADAPSARASIGATTLTEVAANYVHQGPAARTLAAKCAIGVNAVVGFAGDSTADKPYEYLTMGIAAFVKQFPRMNADYYQWDGTSAYASLAPILSGISARTVIMRDNFNRTAADLVGSSPDTGSAWTDTGTGAGDWQLNGTSCVATAAATPGIVLTAVGMGDGELYTRVTLAPTDSPRFYAKWVNSSNHLRIGIETNSGSQVRLSIIKLIGGVQTTVALGEFFYNNATVNTYEVTLRVVGTRVTASINGQVIGGILSGSDVTALSTASSVGISGTNRGTTSIDFVEWASVTAASSPGTVTIYNGSKSGSILSYQEGLIGTLFPSGVTFDTIIINSGHNYGATSPPDYLTAIDSFISTLRTVQSSASIVICSQNPKISPATDIADHANRIAALVGYCMSKGYGYVPTYESFAMLMTISANYVQSDGVHPTGQSDGGAGLQSTALLNYMNRLVGV